MNDDRAELTADELAAGWHFCAEFDELLVGPGMGELEFCTCERQNMITNEQAAEGAEFLKKILPDSMQPNDPKLEEYKAIIAEVFNVAPADPNDSEEMQMITRYMRRRAQVEAEVIRLKEHAAAMIKELETRIAGMDYVYMPFAERMAKRLIGDGKKRSIKTLFGVMGFRKQAKRIVVEDEAALIEWVDQENDRRAMLKREWTIVKAKLDEYVEVVGELPPGVTVEPERDKFYIK